MPCNVNFIRMPFVLRRCMVFALLGSNGALWDWNNDTMSCYDYMLRIYVILALYTHSDYHSSGSIHTRRISCTTQCLLSSQVPNHDPLYMKQLPASHVLLYVRDMV